MMDGVLGQVDLAALPFRAAEHGTQTGVVVGNDILHPAHAARLQALQECPPVDFRLRQGHRDAQNPAAPVRACSYGREHVRRENDSPDRFLILLTIAHHTAHPHLFITGINEEILDFTEGAGAPGLQLLVQHFHRAANPLTGS